MVPSALVPYFKNVANRQALLTIAGRWAGWLRMPRETEAWANDTKAAWLRRLWRSQDTSLHSSGLAKGLPALTSRLPEALQLPSHGLTARELINMAREARGKGHRLPSGSL